MDYAEPFKNIAVSLSGGGYRATCFHLGALGYLNELSVNNEPLLKRVVVISTISGGTLTGVMYALHTAKGGDYMSCFKKLYGLLDEDKLLNRAFDNLNNTNKWPNQTKTKDLINAFSEVYDEYFYDRAQFDILFKAQAQQPGQVAVTLGPRQGISGDALRQNLFPGALQLVAEPAPQLAVVKLRNRIAHGNPYVVNRAPW